MYVYVYLCCYLHTCTCCNWSGRGPSNYLPESYDISPSILSVLCTKPATTTAQPNAALSLKVFAFETYLVWVCHVNRYQNYPKFIWKFLRLEAFLHGKAFIPPNLPNRVRYLLITMGEGDKRWLWQFLHGFRHLNCEGPPQWQQPQHGRNNKLGLITSVYGGLKNSGARCKLTQASAC